MVTPMTIRMRTLIATLIILLMPAAPARAEYQHIDLTIFGMD